MSHFHSTWFRSCQISTVLHFWHSWVMVVLYFSYNFDVVVWKGQPYLPMSPSWPEPASFSFVLVCFVLSGFFSFLLSFLPSCILTPAEKTATYADTRVSDMGCRALPLHTLSWKQTGASSLWQNHRNTLLVPGRPKIWAPETSSISLLGAPPCWV